MKLGAQLYTVRELCQNERDLARTLEAIASIGYRSVQISGVSADIPAQTIRRLCDNHGLDIVVSHTAPQRLLNQIEQVIEDHQVFGAKYIGLGMMPVSYLGVETREGQHHPVRRAPREDTQRFIQDFSPAIERIAAAGMTFLYHNHHFEFARQDGESIFEQLVAGFDPRQVGFLIDTFWIQFGGGDVVAWLEKLAGRIPVVHFKDLGIYHKLDLQTPKGGGLDFSSPIGFQQIMTPVGSGNMDFERITAACKAAGTKHVLVEQDICQGDPLEALRQSFHYLSQLDLA